jgi:hypothetical protein
MQARRKHWKQTHPNNLKAKAKTKTKQRAKAEQSKAKQSKTPATILEDRLMSIDSKEIRGASDPRDSVQEVLFRWLFGNC